MTIRIKCKHCGRGIRAGDEWAGKDGTCPSCGCVVSIPAVANLPPPLEVDEPNKVSVFAGPIEPYYSRSGLSILFSGFAVALLLFAIVSGGQYRSAYDETPLHIWKAENATNTWRLLCASWGFGVLAVLTTISRRVYRLLLVRSAAVVLLLSVAPFARADATPQPPSGSMAARVAEAERRAAELLKSKVVRPSGYTVWRVLGGNQNSTARIIDYDRGLITLQKKNGQLKVVRTARLAKADRAYVDAWKKNTGRYE